MLNEHFTKQRMLLMAIGQRVMAVAEVGALRPLSHAACSCTAFRFSHRDGARGCANVGRMAARIKLLSVYATATTGKSCTPMFESFDLLALKGDLDATS